MSKRRKNKRDGKRSASSQASGGSSSQSKGVATKKSEEKAGGGKSADGSSDDADPRRERTVYDSFRENIEALVVAVILAIIIRHFAVEAFEIPTGSMATTLYGMHAHFECPNCDTQFDCGISSDSTTGAVRVRYQKMVVCGEECPREECELSLHFLSPSGNTYSRPNLQTGGKVLCTSCSEEFVGSKGSYSEINAISKWLRCPICHHGWRAVVTSDNRSGGDKILVNKYAYQVGTPERFDVIVFGFDQWKNYIKRLVGLPGEKIHLIDGDIYVNGQIVRKSRDWPDVQESLWRKISDSDVEERGLNGNAAWSEAGVEGDDNRLVRAWKRLANGRWSLNNSARKEPSVFAYNHRARDFTNYVAYNALSPYADSSPRRPGGKQPGPSGTDTVGDMRLDFTVQPTKGKGWIGCEIRERDWTFQARLPLGKGSATIPAVIERVENDPIAPFNGDLPANGLKAAFVGPDERRWRVDDEEVFLPFNEESRIQFESCDDRVVVRINGEDVLALEYRAVPDVDSPPRSFTRPNQEPGNSRYIWILGSDVQANVGSIQLRQDVYYVDRMPSIRPLSIPIQLEEGQYFALGDNSPSSSDGRAWGHVPEANLMGKALLVFWPAYPWKYNDTSGFRWKFIR